MWRATRVSKYNREYRQEVYVQGIVSTGSSLGTLQILYVSGGGWAIPTLSTGSLASRTNTAGTIECHVLLFVLFSLSLWIPTNTCCCCSNTSRTTQSIPALSYSLDSIDSSSLNTAKTFLEWLSFWTLSFSNDHNSSRSDHR